MQAKPIQFSVTRKSKNTFTVIVQNENEIVRSFDVPAGKALDILEREMEQLEPIIGGL